MKKTVCLILCMLMLFSLQLPTFAASGDIEASTVTQDLQNAGFDLSDFPKDTSAKNIRLITVREYGYSTEHYNLYMYFYNPSGKEIKTFDSVQLANKWDKEGNAVSYKIIPISLVSSSSDNVLYKVKLSNTANLKCLKNSGKRSYFIGGVQMSDIVFDTSKVVDYNLGYIFTFSGSGDSMTCVKNELLTVELEVHQASYLTGDSAKGENYSNQINSVYFSLPSELEDEYGSLYAVSFEYLKYRTMPMVITDNHNSFLTLRDIGWLKYPEGEYPYSLISGNSYYYVNGVYGYTVYYVDIAFGNECLDSSVAFYYYDKAFCYDYLPIIFEVDEIADRTDETTRRKVLVSSDTIQKYFENYNPLSGREEIPVNYSGITVGNNDYNYNGDLFRLDYFENYDIVERTLSLDDEINLKSWADENYEGWFIHFIRGEFGYSLNKDHYDNSVEYLPALQKVRVSDLTGENASDKLCISSNDFVNLVDYINSTDKNTSTYILRYAWSDDYYCNDMSATGLDGKFLVAEETVYLDFDIISLSFKSEDEKVTVIPVSADTTDGFTGIQDTRPNQNLGDNIVQKLNDMKIDYSAIFKKVAGAVIVITGLYLVYTLADSLFFNNNYRRRR